MRIVGTKAKYNEYLVPSVQYKVEIPEAGYSDNDNLY